MPMIHRKTKNCLRQKYLGVLTDGLRQKIRLGTVPYDLMERILKVRKIVDRLSEAP